MRIAPMAAPQYPGLPLEWKMGPWRWMVCTQPLKFEMLMIIITTPFPLSSHSHPLCPWQLVPCPHRCSYPPRVRFLMSRSIYLCCVQLREKWPNPYSILFVALAHLSLDSFICHPNWVPSSIDVNNNPTNTSTRSPDILAYTSSFIAQEARLQEKEEFRLTATQQTSVPTHYTLAVTLHGDGAGSQIAEETGVWGFSPGSDNWISTGGRASYDWDCQEGPLPLRVCREWWQIL